MRMSTLKLIIAELVRDRLVQVGTGSSSLSIFGATQVNAAPPEWVARVMPYIGLAAAVVGVLSGLATLVYAVLKIRRILKHPQAPVE